MSPSTGGGKAATAAAAAAVAAALGSNGIRGSDPTSQSLLQSAVSAHGSRLHQGI